MIYFLTVAQTNALVQGMTTPESVDQPDGIIIIIIIYFIKMREQCNTEM